MNKKFNISVVKDGKIVSTIKRVLWSENIGNFNPIFCRYNKKRTLVSSNLGDLSDPFRREESYISSLYITI